MNHNTPSSSAASKVGTAFSNIRPAPTLAGKWLKDYNSSDMEAMRKALDAMRISGIQVRACVSYFGVGVCTLPAATMVTIFLIATRAFVSRINPLFLIFTCCCLNFAETSRYEDDQWNGYCGRRRRS
jgi:hypothetical protein